jgi:hypothetical protein
MLCYIHTPYAYIYNTHIAGEVKGEGKRYSVGGGEGAKQRSNVQVHCGYFYLIECGKRIYSKRRIVL